MNPILLLPVVLVVWFLSGVLACVLIGFYMTQKGVPEDEFSEAFRDLMSSQTIPVQAGFVVLLLPAVAVYYLASR